MSTAKHLNACIYVVAFSYDDSHGARRKCKVYVASTSPDAFEEVESRARERFPLLFEDGVPGFVPSNYQVDSVKLCMPLGMCCPGLPAYHAMRAEDFSYQSRAIA